MEEQFYNFIYDRQLIWYKKEILKEPFPWTKDKILQTYKFCCPYRECDKGTIHLLENIIRKKLPIETKLFNIIFYRRFNFYGFFGKLFDSPIHPYNFDFPAMETFFDSKISKGLNVFKGKAYTLCQLPFDLSYRQNDKHIQILLAMEEIALRIYYLLKEIKESKCLAGAFYTLKSLKLIGSFLAHQILVDLTYLPHFLKHDINSFVDIGPGAMAGLKLIFPKMLESQATDLCKGLWSEQETAFERLATRGKAWKQIFYKNAFYADTYLSLSNIQHCLCEFRKYIMLQRNPKARKRYYKPEVQYGLL